MTDNPAPENRRHPQWCDPAACTAARPDGGSHCSAVMTLGPLPYTNTTVRANLFATDGTPVPAAMVWFQTPLSDPEDIARAGAHEDITSIVLPLDQVAQLSTFLGGLHDLVAA